MEDQEAAYRVCLDPTPSLRFTTPARYAQQLLDTGVHYESSVLKPAPPLVKSTAAAVHSVPKVEDICQSENSSDNDAGKQLLYACVHNLPTSVVEDTLTANPDLDINAALACANDQGLTPLGAAAMAPQAASTPVLELLVRAGADVDLQDHMGRTAMHWAVLCNKIAFVKALVKHNAKLDIFDNQGFTPLLIACLTGSQDIAAALLKSGPSLSTSQQQHQSSRVSAVMLACFGGHADVVKLLVKHRTNVLAADKHGCCAIHAAVWGGSLKCLKLVMGGGGGGGVQLKDIFGCTPLMHAAAKGDPTICQLLAKKGADFGAVDLQGRTVLHWATLAQSVASVQFVLESQPSLGSQLDNEGATPAHYAAITGNTEILEILRTKHAGLHVEDQRGLSPLVWAAASGRVETVNLLLDDRGLPTAGGQSGRLTPLHAASCVGSSKVCRLLLEDKALEVNVLSPDGYAPLHYACRFGHPECAELLVNAGAQLDLKSSLGDLPIHLASMNGHSDVLEVLISHGAAVEGLQEQDCHRSALHLAAGSGHLGCCRLLVQRGASVSLRDSSIEGFTALDLAMLKGHAGCSDFLLYCHAPSGGGAYHRAALTIQSVWRLYRHKCRRAATKHWSAVVIQRAVGSWLAARKAGRLQCVRERVRNRAASVIQYHWKLYVIERKRYEATYAKLKARLEQEHLATSIILRELHSQARSITLPTPAAKSRSFTKPTPPGHNPTYLLKTSSNPQPLFPSGSLLFPTKPRQPLIRQAPNIRVVQRAQSKGAHPLPVIKESADEPHVAAASESVVCSHRKVRLPPIPSSKIHVGVSAKISMDFPNARRKSDTEIDSMEKSTAAVVAPTQSDHVKLPPLDLLHSSLDSVAKQQQDSSSNSDRPVNSDSAPITLPPIEDGASTAAVDPSSKHEGGTENSEKPEEKVDNSTDESPQTLTSNKNPSQAHFRQTTFKGAPLGYKPPLHKHAKNLTPKSKKKSSTPLKAPSEGGISSEVLHQVQRYDRLNEVLTLLQRAKELGKTDDSEPGVKLSDLKQHIQTALDEAVRLRTDTEALHNRMAGHSSPSDPVNS